MKTNRYFKQTLSNLIQNTDSLPVALEGYYQTGFGVLLNIDVNLPAADTAVTGTSEVATVTFPDAGAKASGNATITNYANLVSGTDDSIEIAGVVFVAQAGAATPGTATFQAVTDNDTTAASLMAQVNAHATTAAIVIASRVNAVVTITALVKGTAANSYTLVYTDNDTNVGATVSGATLSGGDASGITAGDYVVIYDTAGLGWAVAADMGGSAAPTGAIWASIASARKAQVNLSANLSAIQVAAAFEIAFDALASVPFATDDTAADGTMLFTMTARGNVTIPAVKNANDSGAGSITVATTTAGVASAVDITENTIVMGSHGFTTGMKAALTIGGGSLPAGLSATDYYVIVVDSDTLQLATSVANAQAGTEVNITDQGTATQTMTLTPTALAGATYQVLVSADNENWVAYASAVAITADATVLVEKLNPMYGYVKVAYVLTAGRMSVVQNIMVKGE